MSAVSQAIRQQSGVDDDSSIEAIYQKFISDLAKNLGLKIEKETKVKPYSKTKRKPKTTE